MSVDTKHTVIRGFPSQGMGLGFDPYVRGDGERERPHCRCKRKAPPPRACSAFSGRRVWLPDGLASTRRVPAAAAVCARCAPLAGHYN